MTRRRAWHRAAMLGALAWMLSLSGTGSQRATADTTVPATYRLAVWPTRAPSPQFRLVDFDGRTRSLTDYAGRTVIVFFGFLQCPEVCPAELLKFSRVMKRLGPSADQVRILFVTLDPERDTQQRLKSYVGSFDPRFIGLTGTPADIDRVAESFHVEYARIGSGTDYTIDHSTSTFVIDRGGRLRLVGTATTPIDDYVHDLELIVGG